MRASQEDSLPLELMSVLEKVFVNYYVDGWDFHQPEALVGTASMVFSPLRGPPWAQNELDYQKARPLRLEERENRLTRARELTTSCSSFLCLFLPFFLFYSTMKSRKDQRIRAPHFHIWISTYYLSRDCQICIVFLKIKIGRLRELRLLALNVLNKAAFRSDRAWIWICACFDRSVLTLWRDRKTPESGDSWK